MATVTTRPPARRTATMVPARSIWHSSQPPKMSPCGLVSAGIATARSVGSDLGRISGLSDDGEGSGIGGSLRARHSTAGDRAGVVEQYYHVAPRELTRMQWRRRPSAF